jgi:hypothetical protein
MPPRLRYKTALTSIKDRRIFVWIPWAFKMRNHPVDVCFPSPTLDQYRHTNRSLANFQLYLPSGHRSSFSSILLYKANHFSRKARMDKIMASPSSEKPNPTAYVFFCVFSKITMPTCDDYPQQNNEDNHAWSVSVPNMPRCPHIFRPMQDSQLESILLNRYDRFPRHSTQNLFPNKGTGPTMCLPALPKSLTHARKEKSRFFFPSTVHFHYLLLAMLRARAI